MRQLITIATTIGPMYSTMNEAMSAVKVPFEEGEEENGVPPTDWLGSEPCAVEWIIISSKLSQSQSNYWSWKLVETTGLFTDMVIQPAAILNINPVVISNASPATTSMLGLNRMAQIGAVFVLVSPVASDDVTPTVNVEVAPRTSGMDTSNTTRHTIFDIPSTSTTGITVEKSCSGKHDKHI